MEEGTKTPSSGEEELPGRAKGGNGGGGGREETGGANGGNVKLRKGEKLEALRSHMPEVPGGEFGALHAIFHRLVLLLVLFLLRLLLFLLRLPLFLSFCFVFFFWGAASCRPVQEGVLGGVLLVCCLSLESPAHLFDIGVCTPIWV